MSGTDIAHFVSSADANAQAAASSTPVDEEALELFLLDCVYPKEGKQAVEEFLRSTNHALPPQAHAGLSAGSSNLPTHSTQIPRS